MNEATRRRAYNRRRFKSRLIRARAAKLARVNKIWSKRIKKAAAVLAALMQLHGTPALETWVAGRLLRQQEFATEIHRTINRGGRGKAAVKKKRRRE
jgi:hypothetical protein